MLLIAIGIACFVVARGLAMSSVRLPLVNHACSYAFVFIDVTIRILHIMNLSNRVMIIVLVCVCVLLFDLGFVLL